MVGVSSGGWGLRVRVNRQRSTHWHVYSLANAPEHRNHRTVSHYPLLQHRREVSEAGRVSSRADRNRGVNPATTARFRHLVNMEYRSFLNMFRRMDPGHTGKVTRDAFEEVLLLMRTGISDKEYEIQGNVGL